jgi:hypothetical protein
VGIPLRSASDLAVLRGTAPIGSKAILVGAGVGLAGGMLFGIATSSGDQVVFAPGVNHDVAVESRHATVDPTMAAAVGGLVGALVGGLISTVQREQWVPLSGVDRVTLLVRPAGARGRTLLGLVVR